MTGRVNIYLRIFEANFRLLSSKISQLENLKLLEVLVFVFFSFQKFKKLNISHIYKAIIVIFSVSLSMEIFCSSNFQNSFFSSIVVTLNISVISNKATILIFFSESPYGKYLQVSQFERNFIQPPGEPRDQHTGDVQQKSYILAHF